MTEIHALIYSHSRVEGMYKLWFKHSDSTEEEEIVAEWSVDIKTTSTIYIFHFSHIKHFSKFSTHDSFHLCVH